MMLLEFDNLMQADRNEGQSKERHTQIGSPHLLDVKDQM